MQSLKIAFFSPTGTTKAVIEGIARGIDQSATELIDITKPNDRKQPLKVSQNDLLIVAVPVYAGRVPTILLDWLGSIEAQDTPAVCVVVYGNREFDDALLELKDILVKQGCSPIAGAAFIGEHSFSSDNLPIAVGRPDEKDLAIALEFGEKVKAKLASISSMDQLPELKVPGNTPYKDGLAKKPAVDFIAVSDACTQCGVCADGCPVEAIDSSDSTVTDPVKCIWCCACIKTCPENARSIKKGSKIEESATRLNAACKEPKAPELFL